jgi:hypothetical protein
MKILALRRRKIGAGKRQEYLFTLREVWVTNKMMMMMLSKGGRQPAAAKCTPCYKTFENTLAYMFKHLWEFNLCMRKNFTTLGEENNSSGHEDCNNFRPGMNVSEVKVCAINALEEEKLEHASAIFCGSQELRTECRTQTNKVGGERLTDKRFFFKTFNLVFLSNIRVIDCNRGRHKLVVVSRFFMESLNSCTSAVCAYTSVEGI